MWNIAVLEDNIILIHFTKLDVKYQAGSDWHYVLLYLNGRKLISKYGCLRGVGFTGYDFLSFIVMKKANPAGFLEAFWVLHKESEELETTPKRSRAGGTEGHVHICAGI